MYLRLSMRAIWKPLAPGVSSVPSSMYIIPLPDAITVSVMNVD